MPDRWALWRSRCPGNPDFDGELPALLDSVRTPLWFDPCELLVPDARSEFRAESRLRVRGGGWVLKPALVPLDRRPGADFRVRVRFLPTDKGGRARPVRSGYRPDHRILPSTLSGGAHRFVDRDEVAPGEEALSDVNLLCPAIYPSSLWVGQVIAVHEGAKVVASAEVVEVYDPALDRRRHLRPGVGVTGQEDTRRLGRVAPAPRPPAAG